MDDDGMRAWLLAPDDPVRSKVAIDVLASRGLDVVSTARSDLPGVLITRAEQCEPGIVSELSHNGRCRVVVVVVGDPVADPWELLGAGASDVLQWSSNGVETMHTVAARIHRWFQVDRLARADPVTSRMIGQSPAWMSALRWLVEVARYSDASVLVTGESGTGKELAARLVHALDPQRRKGKFVVVDCTTIMASLSGPELFGHERGAFTGAHIARRGAFAEADGGVLFLDEIGELPPSLQPELLRVLQERTFKAIGSQKWERTDFRLVCATNQDLGALEQAGRFRRDLLFRLSAATVRLPSLRERVDDIPLLAKHFLGQLVTDPTPALDPAVERLLLSRAYPGNVRELRQLITQIAIRHVGGPLITAGMLPDEERTTELCPLARPDGLAESVRQALEAGLDLRTLKSTVAELAVTSALTASGGNVIQAARRLGVTARALQLRRAERTRDDTRT
ncbi:sigma 54-interacting transcriptional regulator [Kibdelosporangium philippinense]|uniref:Sigma 54-interacting transcriptional regulator n=1 Tax=Kibdelosporangium philippinense TaxID=211113 RepID=A0ABS8ZXV2_9PSEU|nr:sigma 54-interacting transcriptional regulator [Kibdelosporangium philippinense]MCE7010827.1 sigma 54-interacting transcriptional regulator [Kibdelosporangium philippinense]